MLIALFVNWHLFSRLLIANVLMTHIYYRSEKIKGFFGMKLLPEQDLS